MTRQYYMKFKIVFLILLSPAILFCQEFSLSGNVTDENNTAISFVNVIISKNGNAETSKPEFIKAGITDDAGNFIIENLTTETYLVSFSYLGYETLNKIITLTTDQQIGNVKLIPATETLDETVIIAKKPTIKKEAGKLVFNVENTSLSTGSTMDLLMKTPGVLVQGSNISIKNSTPTIYINDKRVYLSASEVASLLQSTDAGIVKSVEVITNPTAKYDAESGTVLNIVTSKAISIGYKGSVNGTYEQGTYAKYRLGTSHFYKKDWINLYAGYTFSPRKELKEDDNYINFLSPDDHNFLGSRTSQFSRTTRSNAHQGNVVADFKVHDKHEIGISANVLVSPNKSYQNTAFSQNFNSVRVLDSTYTTQSFSNIDTSNLAFNLNHTWQLGDAGANVIMNANYILYDNERLQNVATEFFNADNTFIRENTFNTVANQESDIATAQLDFTIPALSGTIETGIKYSNIDTESGLNFFENTNQTNTLNPELSDLFNYDEAIYAAYFGYARDWNKVSLSIGIRGEQTDVTGTSQSLGLVNNQNYFELFPRASINYAADDDNSYGVSYSRSISRPRYESLNPFRYFVNEFNFADGNPNLQPDISNKYTLSYTYKNKLFFEAYYWEVDNALSLIAFQDNTAQTLQSLDLNLINELQYSFDIMYAAPVLSWWYLQVLTSSFYLENKFFALESTQETETLDTFGLYAEMYSGLTLSEARGLTSDVTAQYISNFLYGAAMYKNQFNLSFSLRKSLWKKRASISMGVDDIFNTNNIPLNTTYLNQDNGYFAREESRLFRIGFKYNFGNARLRDNNRKPTTDESDRLN